jgi:tetratricopeptide (TPR) repeat protein
MSMKLYSLTPNDLGQANSIIDFLMAAGAPGKALTIVEDQMKQNPGETSILETKWKIFQNENRWKEAIATGEEMVKLDPAKADTTYFRRQVGAAIQDSQPQLAMQFLARAVEKFPKNVFFLQAYQNRLKDQGQVQQALEIAKRVLSLDPKPQAYATVVSLYTQTGQADSAVAFAKQALVGADATTKEQIGTGLLGLIRPAMNKAQADTTAPHEVQKENWAQVLRLSASVDSIVPNANSAFYMSVAAFYVAQHGVANLTEVAKASRPQACAMLKDATDKLLIVDLNMSRGGRVDAGTASALLQATSAMKPGIDQAKKQLGCR